MNDLLKNNPSMNPAPGIEANTTPDTGGEVEIVDFWIPEKTTAAVKPHLATKKTDAVEPTPKTEGLEALPPAAPGSEAEPARTTGSNTMPVEKMESRPSEKMDMDQWLKRDQLDYRLTEAENWSFRTGFSRHGEVETDLDESVSKGLIPPSRQSDYHLEMPLLAQLNDLRDAAKKRPLAEQEKVVSAGIEEAVGQKTDWTDETRFQRANWMKFKDKWARQEEERRYSDDPLQYLDGAISTNERDLVSKRILDPANAREMNLYRIGLAIRLQRREHPNRPLRFLANAKRDDMSLKFHQADPHGKLALIDQWRNDYGEFSDNVLEEIKLTPDEQFLAKVGSRCGTAAEKSALFTFFATPPKEDKKTLDLVGPLVEKELKETSLGRLVEQIKASQGENAVPDWMNVSLQTMKQYAAYYVTSRRLDASTSARMVVRSLSSAFDRGYQVIENKDLGYLICDRTYSPGFIKPGLTVLKKKAEADSNGQLTADELFWVNEGEEFALMRRNPGGPATAVLDKKGGRVRVTPMDLVHTMGKSLAKAGYRCDLLFQEIDYARPLDDPKTLDGILDYAKKLDQENTANQKAEWTNKKWDLQTVTAALVKSGLGGHLLAALKEGGVKIKAGGKLKKNNVWVSYCDVDEKTIFILPEYDSATAADTLAEEGKHAVDGMMKKEEKNIIARLMNEWSSQDLYDIEFSGHLARIIMYQDMLAADANVAGRNWSGLRSNSTIEIKELEKGVFGEHIHQEYKDNESYDFSNNPVKIYEPFLDRCAGRTDNE